MDFYKLFKIYILIYYRMLLEQICYICDVIFLTLFLKKSKISIVFQKEP